VSERRTGSREKLAGGVLLSALASGLAATALGGAGTANASCASVSGISVGRAGDCTSTPTSFSVAIGKNATASAQGTMTGTIAVGENATASSKGAFSLAGAFGKNTRSQTVGTGNLAVAQGEGAEPDTDFSSGNPVTALAGFGPSDKLNVALNLGSKTFPTHSPTTADSTVIANGTRNIAVNLFGSPTKSGVSQRPNLVWANGTDNTAFSLFGNGNSVRSGPASRIAGIFGKNDQTVNNEVK
jgi:hypothetical protein